MKKYRFLISFVLIISTVFLMGCGNNKMARKIIDEYNKYAPIKAPYTYDDVEELTQNNYKRMVEFHVKSVIYKYTKGQDYSLNNVTADVYESADKAYEATTHSESTSPYVKIVDYGKTAKPGKNNVYYKKGVSTEKDTIFIQYKNLHIYVRTMALLNNSFDFDEEKFLKELENIDFSYTDKFLKNEFN